MAKKVKHSPAPFYFAAAVWVLWGFCFPLYRLTDFLMVIVFSALAGVVGKHLFPDRVYEVPDPVEPETTGDEQLDALLGQRDRAF